MPDSERGAGDVASFGEGPPISELSKFKMHAVAVAHAAEMPAPEEAQRVRRLDKLAYATAARTSRGNMSIWVVGLVDVEGGAKRVIADFTDLITTLGAMPGRARRLAPLVAGVECSIGPAEEV